jgi:hypothetical protein
MGVFGGAVFIEVFLTMLFILPAISTVRAAMPNISWLTNVLSAPNPKAFLTLKLPRYH